MVASASKSSNDMVNGRSTMPVSDNVHVAGVDLRDDQRGVDAIEVVVRHEVGSQPLDRECITDRRVRLARWKGGRR